MYKFFMPHGGTLSQDLLSGLTVALALVPEAVAFSFVAGVDPLVGLYAAFMMGLITATLGGRPGMISGATGAVAVVVVALVADKGVEFLFLAVVVMGVIQIMAGVLRLGKFIRLVPHPVMLGFVNGLAIIIFLAQLGQFKTKQADGVSRWMQGTELLTMLLLVAVTMLIIYLLPKLTKRFPSSLVAIVTLTLAVNFLKLPTPKVGDIASVAGGFPHFHLPQVPWNLETLSVVFPYAAIMAAVGLIESLMTLSLIDELTETRGRGNKECIGQGTANIITGLFGGMGGCAMIGQSMINVNSGGRGRASGISAALFLLIFILFAPSLIEMIPLAALTGVMFTVVIGTFAWPSLRLLPKIPRSDAFVLVLVSGVTVLTDLAVAVGVGVVVSAMVFAWKSAQQVSVTVHYNEDGAKVYELTGQLFFGSVRSFHDQFQPAQDPVLVIIDFKNSRVFDHSGVEAINNLTERYQTQGKLLRLKHLSKDCATLINNAKAVVDINVIEDPSYHVAVDELA